MGSQVIKPFSEKISEVGIKELLSELPTVIQLNITKKCNLACKHCHVEASPARSEMMSRAVLTRALEIAALESIQIIDITGGAPEMHADLEWFLGELATLNKRVFVRSNLSILMIKEYARFIDIYKKYGVEIVGSLPHIDENATNKQRGEHVYENVISVLRKLNHMGYGQPDSSLKLHLVHNPVGAYLPGAQLVIEDEYRQMLCSRHNIVFSDLFVLTNFPIGRYKEYLFRTDNYYDYMQDLINAFNPCAVDNAMCKYTLSVGYDGNLYDCDFNQMLEAKITLQKTIFQTNLADLVGRKIVVNNHCYACMAGSGASCQGSTT